MSIEKQTGISLGAALSAYLSGLRVSDRMDQSPWLYALGGFLMIAGARTAGGCASGHGLSGMARLSLASVITVAGMFIGGIGAAFAFYR